MRDYKAPHVAGQFFLTALLSLASMVFIPAALSLEIGDPAPDFKLKGSDGKTHQLTEYLGDRPAVIAFFPKAFTGGWTIECKSLRDSIDQLSGLDVVYFMLSTDTIEDNTKFAHENGANFPILSDPTGEVSAMYDVLAGGIARRVTFYIAPNGSVAHVDEKVSVRTAGADIVSRLRALGY
jgi:peroxiredoxin Q/BCP